MNPSRPAVTRLADVVANDLEQRILEGSLKPGDRLPPERALALELDVSRPSLREAIQKLVAKGLLVTKHGGGTVVTDRLEASFTDPWQELLKGHPPLQGDLLEFRHIIEGEAAMLATERATEADILRIDAAYAELEAAYANDDLDACVACDVAFHQAIAEASHNTLIGHVTASLMRVMYEHVRNNLVHLHQQPEQWQRIREQHRAIWQAIHERQPEHSRHVAHEHIDLVSQSMQDSARAQNRQHAALRRLGDIAAPLNAMKSVNGRPIAR